MKTIFKNILAITVFSIVLFSCSKDDTSTPTPVEPAYVYDTNVYVAGVYDNKAAIWKNGVRTMLFATESIAKAVFVSGQDVYVAGQTIESDRRRRGIKAAPYEGKIWKNNTELYSYSGDYCYLNDIEVVGNDVYSVGLFKGVGETNPTLTLFKNSLMYALEPAASYSADVKALKVINGVVFCVGYSEESNTRVATIWKYNISTGTTTKTGIATGTNQSELTAICSDAANNIYVCGQEWSGANGGGKKPFYQKNNDLKQILPITTEAGSAIGIHTNDNKVIVAGSQYNESGNDRYRKPCYWENGSQNLILSSNYESLIGPNVDSYQKSFLFQNRLFQCSSINETQGAVTKQFPVFVDGNRRVIIEKTDKNAASRGIFVTTIKL
jgi:hypothetical protein